MDQIPANSGDSHTRLLQEIPLLDESLTDDVIHQKGSKHFTWLTFKLGQCMSATWINSNHYKEINTLDLRDVKDFTEQHKMMDKSSRDPHNNKGPNIHTSPCEDTSKVFSTPYCSMLSST